MRATRDVDRGESTFIRLPAAILVHRVTWTWSILARVRHDHIDMFAIAAGPRTLKEDLLKVSERRAHSAEVVRRHG